MIDDDGQKTTIITIHAIREYPSNSKISSHPVLPRLIVSCAILSVLIHRQFLIFVLISYAFHSTSLGNSVVGQCTRAQEIERMKAEEIIQVTADI